MIVLCFAQIWCSSIFSAHRKSGARAASQTEREHLLNDQQRMVLGLFCCNLVCGHIMGPRSWPHDQSTKRLAWRRPQVAMQCNCRLSWY